MNTIQMKYDFRGFRLLRCDYTRIKDKTLTSFAIGCRKNQWDEKNAIYELVTEIEIMFGDEKCLFAFSSGYKIIDLEWLELMAEQTVVNELFRVVYPYLCAKIQSFTSDFRPGIILPMFDMKKYDFTKKILFNLNRGNANSNQNQSIN